MNCRMMEQESIAYLDGRIEPRRRREVEEHLAACGHCRERNRQLREVWGILDEAPVLRPSAGFDAAVRMRIAREARRTGWWGWLVPSPRLAIGVTALLVFSAWVSSLPPAAVPPAALPASSGAEFRPADAEFRMIADLPVLEDYDVLANFDALSELEIAPATPVQRPGM